MELGYFNFLAIVNNAAVVDMCLFEFLLSDLLGKSLGVELLNQVIAVCIIVEKPPNCFKQHRVQVPLSSHPLQHLLCFPT